MRYQKDEQAARVLQGFQIETCWKPDPDCAASYEYIGLRCLAVTGRQRLRQAL
jgi:hypothetical protein